jgi:hypothetical protein
MVGPLSFVVDFPIDFFFSCSSISQKKYVAKILGPFDVRKVPEVKSKGINFAVLKPNESDFFRKS